MFGAKIQDLFYLVVLGIFVLEKSLLALKPGCLSYIGVSGANQLEKNGHSAGEIFK